MLAIGVLALFALGYLVLAGADLGVGMLLPYLGRTRGERRLVIAAIAPFFLGNEVWLVVTAGLLVGLFPALEGDLLSGLLPAVVALIAGWVTRDMGLWLRGRVERAGWQALCDGAIVAGSWVTALSWGWILSGVLAGVTDRVIAGPGAALAAIAIALVFAAHGLAFAGLRLTGPLRARARGLTGASGEVRTYALTATAMAGLGIAAGIRLPLAENAADPSTLAFLLPVLLIATPLLVATQAWVWWTFRHRVDHPSYL